MSTGQDAAPERERRRLSALLAGVALAMGGLAASVTPAAACGPDTDCVVDTGPWGERLYRVRIPEDGALRGSNGRFGAIFFAHGYRGSAAGVMRNGALARLASDLGAVLIALDAGGADWQLPNAPRDDGSYSGEREMTYIDAVLADVVRRFDVDPARRLATGFSAGGMMSWTIACERGDAFAAVAPIAGTFWAVPPETCANPPRTLIHIHGDDDPVVPLQGRPIGPTRQGRVDEALALVLREGAFEGPEGLPDEAGLRCQRWANAAARVVEFCLFEGGHSFSTRHVRVAWERGVGPPAP